jgi:glycine cleavage system aminomethyltransferase T
MIGDTIISREEEGLFRIIGVPLVHDWLEFNLINSPFDVTFERNEAWTPFSHHDRDIYRLAIQGPHTAALLTELLGGEIPEVKFFRIGEMQIAGRTVRALRHSMAGQYGFELYGPWADHLAVRDAIQEIGPKYGLRTVGGLQPALPVESGWLALPVPAIYTHPDLKAYREWLDTTRLGTIASLRGSFVSDRIEDYYVTPLEAGYGNFVDWEQDFVGRDALRETADSPRRTKVTLEWNDEDVTAAIGAGLFGRPNPGRFISLPQLAYGSYQNDAIRLDGDIVGLSQTTIYSSNAEHVLSNSVVAVEHAHPGTELTVDWGDPTLPAGGDNGHEIRKIRVKVAPSPYFERLTRF